MCDDNPNPYQAPAAVAPRKSRFNPALGLKELATAAINELRMLKKKAMDRINRMPLVIRFRQFYRERPDLGIIAFLIGVLAFSLLLYKLFDLLFPAGAKYTKSQLKSASLMSIKDFTIDEVAVAELEADGLKQFHNTFVREPYSPENSGAHDLAVATLTLPLVMFIIMYVLPVVAVVYTGWFIWHYWQFVRSAAWGFWLMLYNFMTDKITGSMGCKWYMRMFTGWGCHSPNFMDYFSPWKAEFIDRPIYLESLKYVEMYIAARQKYYTIPKEKYITVPWAKFKSKLRYLKKIYIDRTKEIFFRQFKEKYSQQYDLPRNEFYHWLLKDKKRPEPEYSRRSRAAHEIQGGLTPKERF